MILVKKNRRIHQEEDSEGSWAVSYGDMITLLLSFFVIFHYFSREVFQLINEKFIYIEK